MTKFTFGTQPRYDQSRKHYVFRRFATITFLRSISVSTSVSSRRIDINMHAVECVSISRADRATQRAMAPLSHSQNPQRQPPRRARGSVSSEPSSLAVEKKKGKKVDTGELVTLSDSPCTSSSRLFFRFLFVHGYVGTPAVPFLPLLFLPTRSSPRASSVSL